MMTSNIFTEVKERLNLREVAEYYGLEVNRGGFASCLFHAERTPSMKLYDDHFHCYGCPHHGDVTDLTAAFFNLSPIESTQKLAFDFGIISAHRKFEKPAIKEQIKHYSQASKERKAERILRDYCDFLSYCRREYAPKEQGENLHPLFTHSLTELDKFEYYRDAFIFGSKDERMAFMCDFAGVLEGIERGLGKIKNACRAVEMA
ncbi:MAG: CHC2 zinc finger domain-containing protein [Oscillospiraceae bacterium]|nr:CHC2 zinc finger domain-containing protein [Oscillospiraceae bacterium]